MLYCILLVSGRIVSGSGQTGVQRGLGAMYALDKGSRLGKVYNDGSKGGRSRRSVGARWGRRRRADDNSLLSGNPSKVRDKKINKFS